MNREIKFRVWDIQNERMVFDPDRFEPSYLEDEKKISDFVFYETWRDRDDGIKRSCYVMQVTGLRDKNGKEIYEGDLLIIRGEVTEVKAPSVFEVDAFKVYGYEFCSGFFTDKYDVPTLERFESYIPATRSAPLIVWIE